MIVFISLLFNTVWGESLMIRRRGGVFPMDYAGSGLWTYEEKGETPFSDGERYSFELWNGGAPVRREWRGHVFSLPERQKPARMTIHDMWRDCPPDAPFYSDFFTKVVFAREKDAAHADRGKSARRPKTIFRINFPDIRPDQVLGLCGSGPLFDDWKKVLPMDGSGFPLWTLDLNAAGPFEYKFVIADRGTRRILFWEKGGNRRTGSLPDAESAAVHADAAPVFDAPRWRGSGTAVPVFSLRSEDSFGTGDFMDIKKMARWAADAGQSMLQLLPVNDTTISHTWSDSYPYNAVSAFALHPMYINLQAAGVNADKGFRKTAAELDDLPSLDYERVNHEKTVRLKKLHASFKGSADYDGFLVRNMDWLLPYAVFCCLRDSFGTACFSRWGEYAEYSAEKAEAYASAHPAETGFFFFEQYLLDSQLREAHDYARSIGVGLKGDLPIGISRDSVEAWTSPGLFHLDAQAGAPPDAFARDGQNWGFPTYDWEAMARDGFAWWRKRMRRMSEYFDCFRIDHILGFFRIWEIPLKYSSGLMGHFSPALPYSAEELAAMGFVKPGEGGLFIEDSYRKGMFHPRIDGKDGTAHAALSGELRERYDRLYEDFFYRRHNEFWRNGAMSKLPALLSFSGMLACGEDLGMIPACVPEVMSALRILSLEIQRMPKAFGEEFADTASYPYLSVCATGTHDTSTLRSWWNENREATQRYFSDVLRMDGVAPGECTPDICERIIASHLKSPTMLCILPLQDWLSMDETLRYQGNPDDERINVPAVRHFNWKYRMHLTLETLLADTAFTARLRTLSESAGR